MTRVDSGIGQRVVNSVDTPSKRGVLTSQRPDDQLADFVDVGLEALHVDAYPTDQRLRYQEKLKKDKLEGRAAPKKKPQIVEQHFDDCGADFGPISCFEIELHEPFEGGSSSGKARLLEQLHHLVHPFFGLTGCDVEDSYSQTDSRHILQYDDLMVLMQDLFLRHQATLMLQSFAAVVLSPRSFLFDVAMLEVQTLISLSASTSIRPRANLTSSIISTVVVHTC